MSGSQIPGAQQLLQQITPQNLGDINAVVGGAPPIQPQPQGQAQQSGLLGGNTLASVQQLIQSLGQGQGSSSGFPGVGAATPNQQPLPNTFFPESISGSFPDISGSF